MIPAAICLIPKLTVQVGEIRVTVVHSRLAVPDPVPGTGSSPYGQAVTGHTAQLFAFTGGQVRLPGSARSEKTRLASATKARMNRGSCKAPPPDCRRIVIRLRSGIKGGCDRRTMSSGKGCLVNAHP